MDEELYDGMPPGYAKGDYRGTLNIENVLTAKYADILRYRDMDTKLYCSSVESFLLGCPDDITQKGLRKLKELGLVRGFYHLECPSNEMIVLYDDLLLYIKQELKEINMIFKSGVFGVGHD